MKFDESKKLLDKAKRVIPGAAQTYSKSYRYFSVGAAPAFLEKGDGARVTDADGNEFIDFVLGLGAITLGYNNKEVNRAITEQMKNGISFSQATRIEIELAEKLVEIIPCAEMVKFVKNGSDATTAAIRLARAFTGKEIVACSGYHGYHDWYIGSTENDHGVPGCVKELTKKFEYNNIDSIKRLFEKYPDKIAAVILEPCQGAGPKNNFLEELKILTRKNRALLIFDEVVSGFRLALGGAQEKYGVIPDLTSIGKGMGNGVSISAVTGRADIMKLIDEHVFISTTFGGETLAIAGALATIRQLEKDGAIEYTIELGNVWLRELERMIKEKGLDDIAEIYGVSPHCGIIFKDHDNIRSTEFMTVYQQALIENNILSIGVNNFCQAHTEEDTDQLIKAADTALEAVRKAREAGDASGAIRGKEIRPIFNRH